jgi:hypothetical protein
MGWIWRMDVTYECTNGQARGDAGFGASADEAYRAPDAG